MGTNRKSRCAPHQSTFEISQSISGFRRHCVTRDNILLLIFELFYGRDDRIGFSALTDHIRFLANQCELGRNDVYPLVFGGASSGIYSPMKSTTVRSKSPWASMLTPCPAGSSATLRFGMFVCKNSRCGWKRFSRMPHNNKAGFELPASS